MCSHRRNEAVSTEVEGVSQFGGTPISASTNRGFRSTLGEVADPSVPVVSSRGPGSRQAASVGVVPCVPVVSGFPPDAFVSPAVGVGQSFTWTVSDVIAASGPRPRARCFIAVCASGDFWSSRATGVPHIDAAPASFGSVDRSPDRNPLPSPSVAVGVGHEVVACISDGPPVRPSRSGSVPRNPSDARGVGQEPEPFALVRGTNGGRGQQSPFRIPPAFGKVGEDVREPVSNKLGDVLQEQQSRSHVTYELPDGRPEPPVIVNTAPLSCA